MFGSIQSVCRTYYSEIPENTLQSIGISAIYTFTYHLLTMPVAKGRGYEVNLSKPLMAAAAAGLASLIHALTTPFFNFIFGDSRIYCHRQAIKSGVSILSTDAIFSYSSSRRIDLVAFQVNPYFTIDLFRAAISDFISSIEWINTYLVVSCFGENRLQTSGINTIRTGLGSIGFLPENNSNAVYIAL